MKIGSLCTGYGGLDLAAEAVLGPLQRTGPGHGQRPPADHDLRLWPEYRTSP